MRHPSLLTKINQPRKPAHFLFLPANAAGTPLFLNQTTHNMKIFLHLLFFTMIATTLFAQKKEMEVTKFGDVSFDNYPVYTGKDLGLTYTPKKSVFKIWSPPAKQARLNLYKDGDSGEPFKVVPMKKRKQGVWEAQLPGDQEGVFYTFQIFMDSFWLKETPDPWAKAVGINGRRAMVVDLTKTNPEGWNTYQRPALEKTTDIILYELHMRDISVHPNSGIKHKGKFLGLAETGTKTPDGASTGLDHIKEMGVTHVHLLPVFDFLSLDESYYFLPQYNWGYDPLNYNVPEGTYATDPADGRVRIREFKQMVKALHDNGLRVVMDVVYNHTGGEVENHPLYLLAPNYFYRMGDSPLYMWTNGSGCGNEVASERPMARKFIVESLLYWAKEYHIDGFRVDLMGLHDIETMNLAAAELRKLNPSIFIYGEGWTAGHSPLSEQLRAVKTNTHKLDRIAAFCDEFRDGVKGHVFKPTAKGFINGEPNLEESVKFGIVGAVKHPQVDNKAVNYSQYPWAPVPAQCINYVSCHDNHTLWDRLQNSCPGNTEQEKLAMNKLAQTLVFTSQGIPFLHAGEEFVRSKDGEENSFQSPDPINQINWDNKTLHADLLAYYKNLIQLRKAHPAFRMETREAVAKNLQFLDIRFDNMIGYVLDGEAVGDSWKRILLIFNGNKIGKQIDIPAGNWNIICHNGRIDLNGMGSKTDTKANVQPYSAYILAEW